MEHKKLFILFLILSLVIMSTIVVSLISKEKEEEIPEPVTLEETCTKNPDDPLCINYRDDTHEARGGYVTKMNIGPDMFN